MQLRPASLVRSVRWLLVTGLAAPGLAQVCEVPLEPSSDPVAGLFGYAVAASGDTLVVGVRLDGEGGSQAGAAFVFVRDGAGWSEQAKLLADDAAPGMTFGSAVAIDGDRIAVGAPEVGSFGAGALYVFDRQGTSWTQSAKLQASMPGTATNFGTNVAVDGDTVIAGADHPLTLFPQPGEAYVFVRSGATWVEEQRILPGDSVAQDWFGSSVAIEGDVAVIGASKDNSHGTDSGAVYVFRRTGGVWSEEAKLSPAMGAAFDRFGVSCALEGATVVAGAWGADPPGTSAGGAAFVFERIGGAWVEVGLPLVASDAADGAWFGGALALGGRLVIGANGAGAAYVFEHNGTGWVETERFTASANEPGDSFGFTVGIAGRTAVVGGHLHDGPAGSGLASAFEIGTGLALFGCPREISVGAGGAQAFELDAGTARAGETYWLLGSFTGTVPGLPLGGVTLPLNFDAYLSITLAHPNQAPLSDSLATLDGTGSGSASFGLPPGAGPALAGLGLHHAFAIVDLAGATVSFTSNAVPLDLLP